MNIYLSLLVALVGLITYLAFGSGEKPNRPIAEVGRVTYFAGLLAFLLTGAQQLVHLFSR